VHEQVFVLGSRAAAGGWVLPGDLARASATPAFSFLAPNLGDAAMPQVRSFGTDVFS